MLDCTESNKGEQVARQVRINVWLAERGMTRSSLAKAIGVDRSLITLIINGGRNCTEPVRAKLEALGFPLDVLPEPKSRSKSDRSKGAKRDV